jgi:hypothetical protein
MALTKEEFNLYVNHVLTKAYGGGFKEPTYYAKRKYGKWTIYNKEGWRVAWGLNEKEKNNYMKLLEEKE